MRSQQLPGPRAISQGCGQARSVPPISMPSICCTQAQNHKPSPREPTSGLRGHLKAQDQGLSSQGIAARNQLHSPHSSLFVPQQLKDASHVGSIQSLSHSRYNNNNNKNGLEDMGRGKGKMGQSERVTWTYIHYQM